MKALHKYYSYRWLAARIHKFIVWFNPKNEMRRTYYKVYHQFPDLDNPQNLIEKIFWMQLHTDTSMWTRCADKYAMREFVKECGFEDYLPQNYGKWENVDDIDFSLLPNEFVLKTNNGCGTVLIVRDKDSINEKATLKKLQQWLNVPFGWAGAELHYTRIKPCIIAEELLHEDSEDGKEATRSLTDYKIWCFSGKPECILVVHDRSERVNYTLDMYNTQWERIPNSLKLNKHHAEDDEILPKPSCLNQMMEMAAKLSSPFVEVRVDFYVIKGKPYVGELTFTSGYGNYTDSFYEYLGSKIQLPQKTK